MTAVEILTKAREIIANPYAWIKGDYHKLKNIKGKSVDCYCAMGALREVQGSYYGDATRLLGKVIDRNVYNEHTGFGTVVLYNDKKTTTKRDILKKFTQAIKLAQKEGY